MRRHPLSDNEFNNHMVDAAMVDSETTCVLIAGRQ
jgi:hypothetical protein